MTISYFVEEQINFNYWKLYTHKKNPKSCLFYNNINRYKMIIPFLEIKYRLIFIKKKINKFI